MEFTELPRVPENPMVEVRLVLERFTLGGETPL